MTVETTGTRIIRCCNCRGMIRVAARALSLFCPHCQSRVSAENLRITGSHPGKKLATAGDILVESTARLHLDLVGNRVAIHGRVKGDVTAEVLVEIGPTGCVIGDIRAPRLVMRDGGTMRGRFERTRSETDQPEAQTVSLPPIVASAPDSQEKEPQKNRPRPLPLRAPGL